MTIEKNGASGCFLFLNVIQLQKIVASENIMKKKVFYTELVYLLALVIMAFSAAFTAKADFGMSMVVAPAYILHLKLSALFPWFTFGVSEYVFQGLLILITTVLMRRFKLSYLFSFITAVLYGTLLDGAILILAPIPANSFLLRIIWYCIGVILCSFSVSLFFHTYIAPEAYELIVKEIPLKFDVNINKVKSIYDAVSILLSVFLSFAFFGFGVFKGIQWGTLVCAVVNSIFIRFFSYHLEKQFEFKNRFPLEKYFQ